MRTKSREDDLESNRPLPHPRKVMKTGNWNVRTMHRSGNIAQAGKEITSRGIDITGTSETHWIGQGRVQFAVPPAIFMTFHLNKRIKTRTMDSMKQTKAIALVIFFPFLLGFCFEGEQ